MTILDDASHEFFVAKMREAEMSSKLTRCKARYAAMMLKRELLALYEAYGLSNYFDIGFGTREFERLLSTVKARYPTDAEIATATMNGREPEFPKQMDVVTMYND